MITGITVSLTARQARNHLLVDDRNRRELFLFLLSFFLSRLQGTLSNEFLFSFSR